MIDFHGATLFISLRSPFARRVRLAFLEHGIPFDEKILNVFETNPELKALNPLSRVPVCLLRDGNTLIDSQFILQVFYEMHSQSPLKPRTDGDRIVASRWSAIAVGLSEKIVEYFLETLRPLGMRDPTVEAELKMAVDESLSRFDKFIGGKIFITGYLTQADLDMGTALDYLQIRYPVSLEQKYPDIHEFLLNLRNRPSFETTNPPPQT
jgi:glutathione S-transferase